MQFRRGEQRRAIFLPRRSLLVLSGEARYAWCADLLNWVHHNEFLLHPFWCCHARHATPGHQIVLEEQLSSLDAILNAAHPCSWNISRWTRRRILSECFSVQSSDAIHTNLMCRDHYIPHRQQDVVDGRAIERAPRRVSLTFRQVPCLAHGFCAPPSMLGDLCQEHRDAAVSSRL